MVTFVIGKNINPAIIEPINKGIPPPLGVGFLCTIAGCFLFKGSSINLYFLIKINENGVAITVIIKATTNGINMEFKIFGIF